MEEQKALDVPNKGVVDNIFDKPQGPLQLDIKLEQFSKEEIHVSVDNTQRAVTVEAKHTEVTNAGSVVKQFTRRFTVPPEYKLEAITYDIQKGLLKICIPLM